MVAMEWVITGIVLLAISIISLKKNLLKPTAIGVGIGISIFVTWAGGLNSFGALILFFLLGEYITRYSRKHFNRKQHKRRSTGNVIGNIGPGLVGLAFNPVAFNVFFFASLAAAFADTLSSEIGILSKEKPLRITTLKPVNPGEDGAVSFLGYLAALGGGVVFGVYAFIATQNMVWIPIFAFAGIVGSTIDSILGDTLQRHNILDNNTTNFAAAFITGLVFAFLF